MKTIEARFRIVTPMFLGGADHSATDGIRAPSVKGALRFWWRALNWGRFYKDHRSDTTKALIALHAEEARLFGAAAKTVGKDQVGGQGVFLINVRHDVLKSKKTGDVHQQFGTKDAARYLGYGLMVAFGSTKQTPPTASGQLQRDCFDEAQEFNINLLFRDEIEPSVRNALIFMGLVGGLGSRARHGMGSIALIGLVEPNHASKEWRAPMSPEDYDAQISQLIWRDDEIQPPLSPPFSAFWQNSRVDRLLCTSNCFAALDVFGSAMLMYRSWGRSNGVGGSTVLGKPSERRFDDDHRWFKSQSRADGHPAFHPKRAVFGLPHNYHKDHHHVVSEHFERRSSPLLFHVHPIGNTFIGLSIFMPAQFLPKDERISSNGKPANTNIDWSVITDFLDGKVGNPATAVDRFPAKKAVLP
jgi:CRISPR-associated protein Cmr1